MEFTSYVDLVKAASLSSLTMRNATQRSKPAVQTKFFAKSPTTSRSPPNNGVLQSKKQRYLSSLGSPSRQKTDLHHHSSSILLKKRFFKLRQQYSNHLDVLLLVLQHVQQQHDHAQSEVQCLKEELERQKLTISILQNHNQELELINDTASRKIARLKSKLSEQKNYYLAKLKGKQFNSFGEETHSPQFSLQSKLTPPSDVKQKIRNELRQIEEEEKKWKATIEAQLRKFEEHGERTSMLQQQFELYQKTEEWIQAKNLREEQAWKLKMEQLQQQEKGLFKMQQELERQRSSFEEDLWKHQHKLAMDHEQQRSKFNEEKEKWWETQRKEDLYRRSLLEDLKVQKAVLLEEQERLKQQQQMLSQREQEKSVQETFQIEKFQQQMELLRLKEIKLKQEQEEFFKLQKLELQKLDTLRAQQEDLLKSQQQADKERETYIQMKQQLEKWKLEFENNIKARLEEEYKMKLARMQLVAKSESGSPEIHKSFTPNSNLNNKPSLSEAIQQLKQVIKEEHAEPPPVTPPKATSEPKVDRPCSPSEVLPEKPKLPGSPLNPQRSPAEKSRSFHRPRRLHRTKTFQLLLQTPDNDSNTFPEYRKCPKCKGSFELRKNLLFSMCSCGYVHQPEEDKPQEESNSNKFKVMRTHSKANLVRTSSFDTIPISTNQIEKVSPRVERSSSFHSEAPAPPPLPPMKNLRARKESNGKNLIDEIKELNVDVEKRLNAIAEAATKKTERKETDTMASLFNQIKRIIPDSARRLETMEATEKARQQILEEKKKILDIQLQNQKQALAKTGGIEQLEEQRKKKDAEVFAQYFSEQFYFEDEEDFEVVGVEDEHEELEQEEEGALDLTSLVSSFMSPTENNSRPQPFNIPQLKLPVRDSLDVQMIEVEGEEEEEEEEDLSSLISALVRN